MLMNYFLIRLAFDTAVHFGASDTALSLSVSENCIHADTLFSALCHTALQLHGEAALLQLCGWVREGTFLLSDTMPWRGDDCFLPKPFVVPEARKELPANWRKAMKKMAWIPVRSFSFFSESLQGGEPFDPLAHSASFGFQMEATRAFVSDGTDTVPYRVGLYQFEEDCGLYVILAVESEEQERKLLSLLRCLGMGGIGGKVTSGCGKFHIADVKALNECGDSQSEWLYRALTEEGARSLLLSASLPREEEMESSLKDASFQIVRRGGFAASETYSEVPRKKKTQYFLRAGSVFSQRFEGALYSVGEYGNHPIYRYGKPLFLGVDL